MKNIFKHRFLVHILCNILVFLTFMLIIITNYLSTFNEAYEPLSISLGLVFVFEIYIAILQIIRH